MKKILLGAILLLNIITINAQEHKETLLEEATPSAKTLEDYLSNTDSFTGEKTYYGGVDPVTFMKVKSKIASSQYVSLNVKGSTLNYGCYGVNILFDNGAKIIRSKEKVDTDYNDDGWIYKAFFSPTANEIKLLKTQKVTAIKLYIYDQEYISESAQNTILEDAKIILTTPKPKKK